MLIRINFLLGFGLLVMILFYFGFTWLIVVPLALVAPGWAKIAAGISVLAGVGLTVQILSMAMSNLAGIATYRDGPTALAIFSHAAIVCGHAALAYAASKWFAGGAPPGDAGLLLIGAFYAIGVGIGYREWRQRKATAS